MKTAVCVIVKDETRDLAEWLAYQVAVGFDAIIAYENRSSDATPDILDKSTRAIDLRWIPWGGVGQGTHRHVKSIVRPAFALGVRYNDRNDVRDTTILRYAADVRARLRAMGFAAKAALARRAHNE
ncbi:MAG: glycosyltransferase family 2 protein [Pseudomonadota bacterium]|nr:glycosyltransferase family 2 protein [Pseudomonadota bacterium]